MSMSFSCCVQRGSRALQTRCVRSRARKLQVLAFKQSEVPPDWRVQKMMDTAQKYYHEVWSRGDTEVLQQVVGDQLVMRDMCGWSPDKSPMVVGRKAFTDLLNTTRREYPDMWFEINQFALQDTTHLFVRWTCHGTQLESHNGPASYHHSAFSGVDILAFNAERTQVVEVEQFRQPNAEEQKAHDATAEPSPYEIRLARLHWEPAPASLQAGNTAAAGRPLPSGAQPPRRNTTKNA